MIITSYIEGTREKIKTLIESIDYDFLICADGGYDIARNYDLKVDLVVGDFDSSKMQIPSNIETVLVPIEKDDTDLRLALSIASMKNPQEIFILGGIGGRVDHTIGNIQNMVQYSKNNLSIEMLDPYQSICIQYPGKKVYCGNKNTKFSVFAYSQKVTGLSYTGAYYPLENHTLTNRFPLGISNEFVDDEIEVSIDSGILVVVRTIL